jgi:hypothetical protein
MMINISVYTQAQYPLRDIQPMTDALQIYCDKYVCPVWGIETVKLTVTSGPVPNTWGMVFLDTADAPGALAYHTDETLPLAKVFLKTIIDAGESISVAASHELVEMLVDPLCNKTIDYNGSTLAFEAADPVEETVFMVNAYPMSDFVYPAYFDSIAAFGVQFDQCNSVVKPFDLARGGYQSLCGSDGVWTEVFGSFDKQLRFRIEDRRGHRSEYRKMQTVRRATK